MGYTVSVPCRNIALAADMAEFLKKHASWMPLAKKLGIKQEYPATSLGSDIWPDTLSYGNEHKKTPRVGFNYGPLGGAERVYIWRILGWIAIKAGCKYKLKPYYFYDEKREMFKDELDEYGWFPLRPWEKREFQGFTRMAYGNPSQSDVCGKIRDELQRLSREWEKHLTPSKS